jgi:hypothetical protein
MGFVDSLTLCSDVCFSHFTLEIPINMFGGKILLSSAAVVLFSVTEASARVPVLDKRQYFPANATNLKTIIVSLTECGRRTVSLHNPSDSYQCHNSLQGTWQGWYLRDHAWCKLLFRIY